MVSQQAFHALRESGRGFFEALISSVYEAVGWFDKNIESVLEILESNHHTEYFCV